ncbi:hypothetical protein GCM10027290_54940 [Micromonospora sonneratiae]|uniref:Uncharacterized protein n=1 Tax=Micromonospora sonneratiae TaxID=1184706 RepID=A0ABW3YN32_9ACTN
MAFTTIRTLQTSESTKRALEVFTAMKLPRAKLSLLLRDANMLDSLADRVRNLLGPELAQTIKAVGNSVDGQTAARFVAQTAPFVAILAEVATLQNEVAEAMRGYLVEMDYLERQALIMFIFMMIELAIAAAEAFFAPVDAAQRVATTRTIIQTVLRSSITKAAVRSTAIQMLFMPGSSLLAQLWQMADGLISEVNWAVVGKQALYGLAVAAISTVAGPALNRAVPVVATGLGKIGVRESRRDPLAGMVMRPGIEIVMEVGGGIGASYIVDHHYDTGSAGPDAISGAVSGGTGVAATGAGLGGRRGAIGLGYTPPALPRLRLPGGTGFSATGKPVVDPTPAPVDLKTSTTYQPGVDDLVTDAAGRQVPPPPVAVSGPDGPSLPAPSLSVPLVPVPNWVATTGVLIEQWQRFQRDLVDRYGGLLAGVVQARQSLAALPVSVERTFAGWVDARLGDAAVTTLLSRFGLPGTALSEQYLAGVRDRAVARMTDALTQSDTTPEQIMAALPAEFDRQALRSVAHLAAEHHIDQYFAASRSAAVSAPGIVGAPGVTGTPGVSGAPAPSVAVREAVEREVRLQIDRGVDAILGTTALPTVPARPGDAQVTAVTNVVRQATSDLPARFAAASTPVASAPAVSAPAAAAPVDTASAPVGLADAQFTALAERYGTDPAGHEALATSFQQEWLAGYHEMFGGAATPPMPSPAVAPGTVEIDAERWRRTGEAFDFSGDRVTRPAGGGERIAVRYALTPRPDAWVFQVRLHLTGQPGVDLDAVRQAAQEGVTRYLNEPGYRLPQVDVPMRVEVQFVDDPGQAHATIAVGSPDSATDQVHWAFGQPPATYAHEILHFLGATDAIPPRRQPRTTDTGPSLMGHHHPAGELPVTDSDLRQIVDTLAPHYAGVAGSPGPVQRPTGAASAAEGQTSVAAFWASGQDTPPRMADQQPPGPDPMFTVRGDGYCMLYAFIATNPDLVRTALGERLSADLQLFLSDPARVRDTVARTADMRVPRDPELTRVSEALRDHVRDYLDRNADRLPADVVRQRPDLGQGGQWIQTLSDEEVLGKLVERTGGHVTDAGFLDRAALESRYSEVHTNLMESGRDPGPLTTVPQQQLEFVNQHGGFPVAALAPQQAREYLVDLVNRSDGPLESAELTEVRATVEGWDNRWSSTRTGPFLLPLLAHATGSRITVLQTTTGHGVRPVEQQYGPPAGQPVTLYHVALDPAQPDHYNHYNAAVPEVSVKTSTGGSVVPPKPPAPEPETIVAETPGPRALEEVFSELVDLKSELEDLEFRIRRDESAGRVSAEADEASGSESGIELSERGKGPDPLKTARDQAQARFDANLNLLVGDAVWGPLVHHWRDGAFDPAVKTRVDQLRGALRASGRGSLVSLLDDSWLATVVAMEARAKRKLSFEVPPVSAYLPLVREYVDGGAETVTADHVAVLDSHVSRLGAAKWTVDRDGLLWAAGFRTLRKVLGPVTSVDGKVAGPATGKVEKSAPTVKTPDQLIDEHVSSLRNPKSDTVVKSSYVPWAERALEVRWLARQAGLTVSDPGDASVLDTVVQMAHRQYRKDHRGARPLGPLSVPVLRRVVEVKLGVDDSAPLSMDMLKLVADKSVARQKWEQSHAFQAWARRQLQRTFGNSQFDGGGARWHVLDGGYRRVVTRFQHRAEKWDGMPDAPAARRTEEAQVRKLVDTTDTGRSVSDAQIKKLVSVRRKYYAHQRNRSFAENAGFADYRWMTQQFLNDSQTNAANIEKLATILSEAATPSLPPPPSPEADGSRPDSGQPDPAAGSSRPTARARMDAVIKTVGARADAVYKAGRAKVDYGRKLIQLATADWKSPDDHQGAESYRPSLPGHTAEEIAERGKLITSFHNVLDISSFVPDVAGWLNRITPGSKGSVSAAALEQKLKSSLGKAVDDGVAFETADRSFDIRLWAVPVAKPVSGEGNWISRGSDGSILQAGKAELRWFSYREAAGSRFDGSLWGGELMGTYQGGIWLKGEIGGLVQHSRQFGSRALVSNNPAQYQFLRMKEDGGRVEVELAWVARVQDRETGKWQDFTLTTDDGSIRHDRLPYLVAKSLLPHDEKMRNNGKPSDLTVAKPGFRADMYRIDPDYLVTKQINDPSEFPLSDLDFGITRLDFVARVMTMLRQRLSVDDFTFWQRSLEGDLSNSDLSIDFRKLLYSGDDIQEMFRINKVRGERTLNLTLTAAEIMSVIKRSEVDISNELRFDDIRGNVARSMNGRDRQRRGGGGFIGQIKLGGGPRFGGRARVRFVRGSEIGRNHRALITRSKRLGGLLQNIGFDFTLKLNVVATNKGEVTSNIEDASVEGGSADALMAAVDVYTLRRVDGERLFVPNPKLIEYMQGEVAKADAGSEKKVILSRRMALLLDAMGESAPNIADGVVEPPKDRSNQKWWRPGSGLGIDFVEKIRGNGTVYNTVVPGLVEMGYIPAAATGADGQTPLQALAAAAGPTGAGINKPDQAHQNWLKLVNELSTSNLGKRSDDLFGAGRSRPGLTAELPHPDAPTDPDRVLTIGLSATVRSSRFKGMTPYEIQVGVTDMDIIFARKVTGYLADVEGSGRDPAIPNDPITGDVRLVRTRFPLSKQGRNLSSYLTADTDGQKLPAARYGVGIDFHLHAVVGNGAPNRLGSVRGSIDVLQPDVLGVDPAVIWPPIVPLGGTAPSVRTPSVLTAAGIQIYALVDATGLDSLSTGLIETNQVRRADVWRAFTPTPFKSVLLRSLFGAGTLPVGPVTTGFGTVLFGRPRVERVWFPYNQQVQEGQDGIEQGSTVLTYNDRIVRGGVSLDSTASWLPDHDGWSAGGSGAGRWTKGSGQESARIDTLGKYRGGYQDTQFAIVRSEAQYAVTVPGAAPVVRKGAVWVNVLLSDVQQHRAEFDDPQGLVPAGKPVARSAPLWAKDPLPPASLTDNHSFSVMWMGLYTREGSTFGHGPLIADLTAKATQFGGADLANKVASLPTWSEASVAQLGDGGKGWPFESGSRRFFLVLEAQQIGKATDPRAGATGVKAYERYNTTIQKFDRELDGAGWTVTFNGGGRGEVPDDVFLRGELSKGKYRRTDTIEGKGENQLRMAGARLNTLAEYDKKVIYRYSLREVKSDRGGTFGLIRGSDEVTGEVVQTKTVDMPLEGLRLRDQAPIGLNTPLTTRPLDNFDRVPGAKGVKAIFDAVDSSGLLSKQDAYYVQPADGQLTVDNIASQLGGMMNEHGAQFTSLVVGHYAYQDADITVRAELNPSRQISTVSKAELEKYDHETALMQQSSQVAERKTHSATFGAKIPADPTLLTSGNIQGTGIHQNVQITRADAVPSGEIRNWNRGDARVYKIYAPVTYHITIRKGGQVQTVVARGAAEIITVKDNALKFGIPETVLDAAEKHGELLLKLAKPAPKEESKEIEDKKKSPEDKKESSEDNKESPEDKAKVTEGQAKKTEGESSGPDDTKGNRDDESSPAKEQKSAADHALDGNPKNDKDPNLTEQHPPEINPLDEKPEDKKSDAEKRISDRAESGGQVEQAEGDPPGPGDSLWGAPKGKLSKAIFSDSSQDTPTQMSDHQPTVPDPMLTVPPESTPQSEAPAQLGPELAEHARQARDSADDRAREWIAQGLPGGPANPATAHAARHDTDPPGARAGRARRLLAPALPPGWTSTGPLTQAPDTLRPGTRLWIARPQGAAAARLDIDGTYRLLDPLTPGTAERTLDADQFHDVLAGAQAVTLVEPDVLTSWLLHDGNWTASRQFAQDNLATLQADPTAARLAQVQQQARQTPPPGQQAELDTTSALPDAGDPALNLHHALLDAIRAGQLMAAFAYLDAIDATARHGVLAAVVAAVTPTDPSAPAGLRALADLIDADLRGTGPRPEREAISDAGILRAVADILDPAVGPLATFRAIASAAWTVDPRQGWPETLQALAARLPTAPSQDVATLSATLDINERILSHGTDNLLATLTLADADRLGAAVTASQATATDLARVWRDVPAAAGLIPALPRPPATWAGTATPPPATSPPPAQVVHHPLPPAPDALDRWLAIDNWDTSRTFLDTHRADLLSDRVHSELQLRRAGLPHDPDLAARDALLTLARYGRVEDGYRYLHGPTPPAPAAAGAPAPASGPLTGRQEILMDLLARPDLAEPAAVSALAYLAASLPGPVDAVDAAILHLTADTLAGRNVSDAVVTTLVQDAGQTLSTQQRQRWAEAIRNLGDNATVAHRPALRHLADRLHTTTPAPAPAPDAMVRQGTRQSPQPATPELQRTVDASGQEQREPSMAQAAVVPAGNDLRDAGQDPGRVGSDLRDRDRHFEDVGEGYHIRELSSQAHTSTFRVLDAATTAGEAGQLQVDRTVSPVSFDVPILDVDAALTDIAGSGHGRSVVQELDRRVRASNGGTPPARVVLRTDATGQVGNATVALTDETAVPTLDRVQLARDLAASLGTPVELRVGSGTTVQPPFLAYPSGEVVRLDVTGRPETLDGAVRRLPPRVQEDLAPHRGRPEVESQLKILHEAEIESLHDFGTGVVALVENLNRHQGYLAYQWVVQATPPVDATGLQGVTAGLNTEARPAPAGTPPAGPVDAGRPDGMAAAWLAYTPQQRADMMADLLATASGPAFTVGRPTRNRPDDPPVGSRVLVVAGSAVAAGVVLPGTQLRWYDPVRNQISTGSVLVFDAWATDRAGDGAGPNDIWYVVLLPAPTPAWATS